MYTQKTVKPTLSSSTGIEAFVFDLDGTLVQSERLSWKAWTEFLHEYGAAMGEEDFRSFIGTQNSAEVIRDTLHLPLTVREISEEHHRRVNEILEDGLEITAGMEDLLDDLSSRGLLMAVASNSGRRYVHRVLEITGFRRYFRAVVARNDVAEGKPAPDVYLEAARQLGVKPVRCMAVEDSPVGLQAALAAEMIAIAVPNPDLQQAHFEGAHHRFDSMVCLHKKLNSLLSA